MSSFFLLLGGWVGRGLIGEIFSLTFFHLFSIVCVLLSIIVLLCSVLLLILLIKVVRGFLSYFVLLSLFLLVAFIGFLIHLSLSLGLSSLSIRI